MALTDRLHTFWSFLFNRNLQGKNAVRRLQGLYAVPNPWKLDSDKEQARFAWTARLVEGLPARPARLLEIGSGEGHQSAWLAPTCERLTGVDVSELAVARAAKRLPAARFSTTPWLEEAGQARLLAEAGGPFDLVTACEVLYYLADVPAALAALERLGRTVLVTCYAGKADYVWPHLRARAGDLLREDRYTHPDGTAWQAAWWTPARPA